MTNCEKCGQPVTCKRCVIAEEGVFCSMNYFENCDIVMNRMFAEFGRLGGNVEKLRSWSPTYTQLRDLVAGMKTLLARRS